MGPILESIGAQIQTWATNIVNWLTPIIEKMNEMLGFTRKGQNEQLYNINKRELPEAQARVNTLISQGAKKAQKGSFLEEQLRLETQRLKELEAKQRELQGKLYPATTKLPQTPPVTDPAAGADGKDDKKRADQGAV